MSDINKKNIEYLTKLSNININKTVDTNDINQKIMDLLVFYHKICNDNNINLKNIIDTIEKYQK